MFCLTFVLSIAIQAAHDATASVDTYFEFLHSRKSTLLDPRLEGAAVTEGNPNHGKESLQILPKHIVSSAYSGLGMSHARSAMNISSTALLRDESAELQARIDELWESGGGILWLEPRTYLLGSALRFRSNMTGVSVRGMGTSTVLKAAPANDGGLVIFEGARQCGLHDLVVTDSTLAAAVSVRGGFWIEFKSVHFFNNYMALLVESANTVTLSDSLILNVMGPSAISVGAPVGQRVDIFQATRVTTNQDESLQNVDCIWLHIGQGVNTVRLDNFGLINGAVGIRMDSDWPVGQATSGGQDPMFLFANDLEIDFPRSDSIQLVRGRVANCVNCYIQGSKEGNGIHVGKNWTAELQVTNSRISGHARAGVSIEGGRHAVLTGNIIADNSQAGMNASSGVEIGAGVDTALVSSNRIGAVQSALVAGSGEACNHRYGVLIEQGAQNVLVSSNLLGGNQESALHDPGQGAMVVGNLPAA